jgi:hypothetical protein
MVDLEMQPKSCVILPGRVLANRGRMMVTATYKATNTPNTIAT